MTRMAGPDCAVMCNLININTHTQCSSSSSSSNNERFDTIFPLDAG